MSINAHRRTHKYLLFSYFSYAFPSTVVRPDQSIVGPRDAGNRWMLVTRPCTYLGQSADNNRKLTFSSASSAPWLYYRVIFGNDRNLSISEANNKANKSMNCGAVGHVDGILVHESYKILASQSGPLSLSSRFNLKTAQDQVKCNGKRPRMSFCTVRNYLGHSLIEPANCWLKRRDEDAMEMRSSDMLERKWVRDLFTCRTGCCCFFWCFLSANSDHLWY